MAAPKSTKVSSYKVDVEQTHSPKAFIRGNKSYFVCDHCGKEVEEDKATKISKGKLKDYVYCPECTKELYPKYKKISFYNPNPTLTGIMREGLARYEKLR